MAVRGDGDGIHIHVDVVTVLAEFGVIERRELFGSQIKSDGLRLSSANVEVDPLWVL